MQTTPTQAVQKKEGSARAMAGKALMAFLALMATLTMVNRTLTEMIIPTVTPVSPQRGALEIQINADGTLAAAESVPVVVPDAARVIETYVKSGAPVERGTPVMSLDYTDVLKEKHAALMEALGNVAQKEQAYQWAKADISKSKVNKLEARREELEQAENKLAEARQKLLGVIEERQAAEQLAEKAESALEAAKASGGEREIESAQAAFDEADKARKDAESAVKSAERAVSSAQSSVTSSRNRLGNLTKSREFVKASTELAAAQESLSAARRAFFDMCAKLDNPGVDPGDEERIIQVALAQIGYGGGETDELPFDTNKTYTATVYAPVDGDVISLDISAGTVVTPSTPVMTIGSRSGGLSLTVRVDEDEAEEMAVGDMAEITVDDVAMDCPIVAVSVSQEETGMFDVEFALPQDMGAVGKRASMRFKKRTQNYDLLIPLSALHTDNDGDFVYVVEQQEGSLGARTSVKRVDVYVLEKDSTRAALQGGVTQRDLLVSRSDRDIQDGDRVRLEGN